MKMGFLSVSQYLEIGVAVLLREIIKDLSLPIDNHGKYPHHFDITL